jgi:DNA repair ATPase RecN
MADHHVLVSKRARDGRHVVQVETLDTESRVVELARLLAGDRGGEAARTTARELLARAG